jgi:hypothetical protein
VPAACALIALSALPAVATEAEFAYETAWALSGPCCGDSGHDIAVESDGSFFIVGNYGALDLDLDGTVDQQSEGGHDAILLKGRPSGELAWVRAPRSPAASHARLTVALDRSGGVFIAGSFIDSLSFRSGEKISGRGPADGLLARYNAEGDPLWARAIGGPGTDLLVDAATDAAGNVVVVGTVEGEVDVDSDLRTDATVARGRGLLVASYDRSGALRWARVATGAGDLQATGVAVTPQGAAMVAGFAEGEADLDGDGRNDLSAPGSSGAVFLASFDPSGKLLKAATLSGEGVSRVSALAPTTDGDLLAAGFTTGAVDLNGDGAAEVVSTGGAQTPFLARLGREGGLIWARALPPGERLSILDLAASGERIAVSGLFKAGLDLDGDGRPDAAADPDGKSEGFIAILDGGGGIRQVLAITGPGHDQPRGVAFSADARSISITGFVRLTADFDGDGQPEGAVRCDHHGDIVWARYRLQP